MKENAYQNLIAQFQEAHEKQLVSTFYSTSAYFSVTFSESLHEKTVSTLIKMLEYKYHSQVMVIVKDPLTIEVWDKGVAF